MGCTPSSAASFKISSFTCCWRKITSLVSSSNKFISNSSLFSIAGLFLDVSDVFADSLCCTKCILCTKGPSARKKMNRLDFVSCSVHYTYFGQTLLYMTPLLVIAWLVVLEPSNLNQVTITGLSIRYLRYNFI